MSNEKVRLLIRLANQVKSDSERKMLLEVADEILANQEDYAEKGSPVEVKFPIRIFRRYKHNLYEANLLKGWRVQYEGRVFSSPSAAAVHISGHPENGWRMWKYTDESTNKEEPIDRLRGKR